MAETTPQTFENHTRFVPAYHMGVFGIFAINLLWSIYKIVRAASAGSGFAVADALVGLLLAVAFLILFFYARMFPLTVQDRVIRLEMRLRLQKLLPAELAPRIDELTVGQLAALRFASDPELPELTRKVLTEKLTDRKTIKRMIKSWQPDYQRA